MKSDNFHLVNQSGRRRRTKWVARLAVLALVVFFVIDYVSINHQPIIISLKADRAIVATLGSCQLECFASDEDGDELSYEWSATDSNIDGNGAIVTWVAPSSADNYTVLVKVSDGNGGEVEQSIALVVEEADVPRVITSNSTVIANNAPTVTSLVADKKWVVPSGNCGIECDAEDLDGDSLVYEWAATGGSISGMGSIVTWNAPEAEGTYNVTVNVTDDKGSGSMASVNISVAINTPPVISSLIVTPKERKYVKKYLGGYKILIGKSCYIECVASDQDGDKLIYEWVADGGDITGDDPVAFWKAPNRGDEVTISVAVSDRNGGVATESIFFKVKTCACAF